MKKKQPDYTPKEAAYDIAIGWIKEVYQGHTRDITNFDGTPAYERAVKVQLAKLHNQLLEGSGLDGIALDEVVAKE